MEKWFEFLVFMISNFTMEGVIEVFFRGREISGGIKDLAMVAKFGSGIVSRQFGQEGFDGRERVHICFAIFDTNIKTNRILFRSVVCIYLCSRRRIRGRGEVTSYHSG